MLPESSELFQEECTVWIEWMAKQSRKPPQKVFPESYQSPAPPSNFLYTSKYRILKGLAWAGADSLNWSQRNTQQNLSMEESSWIVINFTLYDLVPLFTHSFLYSRVNINTYVNSRCLKREGSHSPGTAFACSLAITENCIPFGLEVPVQRSWSWTWPFPQEATHCPSFSSRGVWQEEHSNPLVQAEQLSLQASRRKRRGEKSIPHPWCRKTPHLLWQNETILPYFG